MKEAAKLHGYDIGLPPWESDVIETARGFLSVHTAAERRLFRLRVDIIGFAEGVPGFAWDIGSTDDLGLLVQAVAAWRGGMPLDELKARFEFLKLDEFARAIENAIDHARRRPPASGSISVAGRDEASGPGR